MIVQHVAVHVENVPADLHQILQFVEFFHTHVEWADVVQSTVDDTQPRSLHKNIVPKYSKMKLEI